MEYTAKIKGLTTIIMHSCAAMDESNSLVEEKAEIMRKKGSNRTSADKVRLKEIDTLLGFWIGENGEIEIPTSAIRRCLEDSAKKLKQGGQVREGLIVTKTTFHYDKSLGETLDDLSKNKEVQLTTPAVIGKSRILITRPHFKEWSCNIEIDAEEDLVDISQLKHWFEIGGRRVGLGDWRPQKSGLYGRYRLTELKQKETIE